MQNQHPQPQYQQQFNQPQNADAPTWQAQNNYNRPQTTQQAHFGNQNMPPPQAHQQQQQWQQQPGQSSQMHPKSAPMMQGQPPMGNQYRGQPQPNDGNQNMPNYNPPQMQQQQTQAAYQPQNYQAQFQPQPQPQLQQPMGPYAYRIREQAFHPTINNSNKPPQDKVQFLNQTLNELQGIRNWSGHSLGVQQQLQKSIDQIKIDLQKAQLQQYSTGPTHPSTNMMQSSGAAHQNSGMNAPSAAQNRQMAAFELPQYGMRQNEAPRGNQNHQMSNWSNGQTQNNNLTLSHNGTQGGNATFGGMTPNGGSMTPAGGMPPPSAAHGGQPPNTPSRGGPLPPSYPNSSMGGGHLQAQQPGMMTHQTERSMDRIQMQNTNDRMQQQQMQQQDAQLNKPVPKIDYQQQDKQRQHYSQYEQP